jgi:His-Xaa-Ser system radical SAM maturase HxsB
MAVTYFNESCVIGKEYVLNFHRIKRLGDKFLLVADHGGWVILTKEEYKSILKYKLEDSLFKILEEKGIILTKNNIETVMRSLETRTEYLKEGAGLHIIVPTTRCNQKCVYCHSSVDKECAEEKDMNEETASRILEFIFQAPKRKITIEFQGGEPTLNEKLLKFIVSQAKIMNKKYEKQLKFSLVTNLTSIREETIDWAFSEGVDICTSLDGPEKIHDISRVYENGKGTYNDLVRKLNLLRDKNITIGALMVTTRHSLQNWKEIIDEYVKWGHASIQIKYLDKIGFAKGKKSYHYPVDEFLDFWKKSVDYIISLNEKGICVKERYVTIILKKILTSYDAGFLDLRSPCGMVIGQLAYNYNGDIYTCDEGRSNEMFKLGSALNNTYKEVIGSEKAQQFINSSINYNFLCDACVYRPFCGTCPVINFAEEGNLLPKLSTSSKCKIFKFQFDYVFEKMLDEKTRNIFFQWVTDWGSS